VCFLSAPNCSLHLPVAKTLHKSEDAEGDAAGKGKGFISRPSCCMHYAAAPQHFIKF